MSSPINEVSIPIINSLDEALGKFILRPYSSNSQRNTLFVAESREIEDWGEEEFQILEGERYEYKLEWDEKWHGLRIRDSLILRKSTLTNGITGSIEPGLNTGKFPIYFIDEMDNDIAFIILEVQSVKLNYRTHYREMLNEVAEKSLDLLVDIRAPAQSRFIIDSNIDPSSIAQKFAFLNSLINSREFEDAIVQIVNNPYQIICNEEEAVPIQKGFRPNGKIIRELVHRNPRINVPETHPLYSTLSTIPASITKLKRVETVDVSENQFIKYAIEEFVGLLVNIETILLRKTKNEDKNLFKSVAQLKIKLLHFLDLDFFKEISSPNFLPLGSVVLQRRNGYREILQFWLKFHIAAQLIWKGGDDVFLGGKRDVAALYEYWVFFKLIEIMRNKFNFPLVQMKNLFEETSDGFSLKLKSGKALALEGNYDKLKRPLIIKFCYNRTFSRNSIINSDSKEINYPLEGAWTRRMRPDYTLSIWPQGISESTAEEQELIVHIHFDAKYRVEKISDFFGSDDESELDDSDTIPGGTSAKRADLLKMHAYRDAIRRTEGAYVIYPGSNVNKGIQWRGFHELLPGLGAFPLIPDSHESGNEISKFIDDVLIHCSNRISKRERESYHRYKIHNNSKELTAFNSISELENEFSTRIIPADEHKISVCVCKSESDFEFFCENGIYYFSLNTLEPKWNLWLNVIKSEHLLIISPKEFRISGLLRITDTRVEFNELQDSINIKFKSDYSYPMIVLKVELDNNFSNLQLEAENIFRSFSSLDEIPLLTTLTNIIFPK